MSHKNILGRALLTCTMAGGLMAVSTPARADRNDDEECRDRVAKAETDVDRDAAKHGERSSQVSGDLKKLDSAREWCAKHHADWDHSRDKDYGRYRDLERRKK